MSPFPTLKGENNQLPQENQFKKEDSLKYRFASSMANNKPCLKPIAC